MDRADGPTTERYVYPPLQTLNPLASLEDQKNFPTSAGGSTTSSAGEAQRLTLLRNREHLLIRYCSFRSSKMMSVGAPDETLQYWFGVINESKFEVLKLRCVNYVATRLMAI